LAAAGGGAVIRGTLYLMIGQAAFVFSGYAINIMLSRQLGVEQYGVYGVVMSVLIWVELSVIVGIPTALQKFIGEDHTHAHTLRKLAFGMQLKYSEFVFLLFFLSSGVLAELLNDHRLAFYLRIAALDIVLYALYRLFLNVHNGMKNFGKQTIVSVVYAGGKMVAIFVLVWRGLAVAGALLGNAIGSGLGLLSAILLKPGVEPSERVVEKSKIIRYAVPIILFTLLINLFLSLDLWFVQALLDSTAAGYYVAASTIAKAPYFLFLALSFTLLPSLARAKKDNDARRVQQLVWQSTRVIFLALSFIVVMIMLTAKEIIDFLFTSLYAPATGILQVLICGLSFLTVFMVFATMLNVDDRPSSSMWIATAVVAVNVALNLWMVRRYGILGAAWATTCSTFIGMSWAGFAVYRKFRARFDARSLLRILGAATLAFAVGAQFSSGVLYFWTKIVAVMTVYFGALYLFGEIRAEEISRLMDAVLSRAGKSAAPTSRPS